MPTHRSWNWRSDWRWAAHFPRPPFSAALWWLVFYIPLFKRVPEPPHRIDTGPRPAGGPLRVAASRLRTSVRELRSYPQAFLLLGAFVLYNDGIQTVIKMATPYGTALGISKTRGTGRHSSPPPTRAGRGGWARAADCLRSNKGGSPRHEPRGP